MINKSIHQSNPRDTRDSTKGHVPMVRTTEQVYLLGVGQCWFI
jgi:hypothetical protein